MTVAYCVAMTSKDKERPESSWHAQDRDNGASGSAGSGEHDDGATPQGTNGADGTDDLGSATRALTDALRQLTRVVAETAQEGSRATVASALRRVSADIAATSEKVAGSAHDSSEKVAGSARDSSSEYRAQQRRRAAQTREIIMAAAKDVFAAKGYEGASVADIAAEAGYTKGAVYAAFPSKEALFLAVATDHIHEQADALHEGSTDVEAAPDPRQACRASDEDILLGAETWMYAVRHEESRAQLESVWRHSLEAAAQVIARAQGRQEPTQADRDTAFGFTAINTLGGLARTVLDSEEIDAMSERLTARLIPTVTEPPAE